MAQKVKITAVNGRYATTADGRQLRIIGNVNPHGTAYTDGVVVVTAFLHRISHRRQAM